MHDDGVVSNPTSGPGTVQGDSFGSPDGLWMDPLGRLWVQTDAAAATLLSAEYANLRNTQMLVADVDTGVTRRFLVGPVNCEITGLSMSPDHRALFGGIIGD
jgi:hypothetical protein